MFARFGDFGGGPALLFLVKVIVTPQFLHHFRLVQLELVGEDLGESGQGETPLVFSGTESHVSFLGEEEEVAHFGDFILRNNDINHVNHSHEVLIHGFSVHLEFQDLSVDFVDEQHGSDSFSHGLSQHGFGLDAHTFDGIDDDEGTIGNSQGSGDFSGEIDVTGGVNKIDDEAFLGSGVEVGFVIKGHTSGFDGDTSFLLVISGIHITFVSGVLRSDNSGLGHQGVG